MSMEKMQEEFEAAIAIESGEPLTAIFLSRKGDTYATNTLRFAWWAWKFSREVILVPPPADANAWRVIDRKGKRFTVYNQDLAEAIADEGLAVTPMCDVPPTGWECSRDKGHEGPCAASEVQP